MTISPAALFRAMTSNMLENSGLETVGELSSLTNLAAGLPFYVFGAGPSLWPLTRKFASLTSGIPRDRYMVVCVDRAYRCLLHFGITPNLVVCIDYQPETETFFKGLDCSKPILLANTTCWPGAARMFDNRVFYRDARTVADADLLPGELGAWPAVNQITMTPGYVGGVALIAAEHLGAGSVALLGYDGHFEGRETIGLKKLREWIEDFYVPLFARVRPDMKLYNCTPNSKIQGGFTFCDLEYLIGCHDAGGPSNELCLSEC